MRLRDRIALVTGGASGIGRATALLFAEEGARVVVNDVSLEAASETVKAMSPVGRAIQADVSDSAQVKTVFAELDREFGAFDILVNNAGIGDAARGAWAHAPPPVGRAARGGGDRPLPGLRRGRLLHRPVVVPQRRPLHRLSMPPRVVSRTRAAASSPERIESEIPTPR